MRDKTEIYKVKSGESISIIARDLLGDIKRWPEIAFINGISYPYFIYPGQVLELPPEKGGDVVEVVSTVPVKSGNATRQAFSFSPATVKLALAGAVFFFLTR